RRTREVDVPPGREVPALTYPDWVALCDRHPALARHCGAPVREPTPPAPMTIGEAARFAATCRDPQLRPILSDVLLDVLAEPLGEMVAELVGPRQGGNR